MIEYGDTRVPESFWEKVHTVPGTDCWVWTGALKKETVRSNKIAIIHPNRQRVTTLLVYMGEVFYNLNREKQKAMRSCDDATCANPNHVQIFLKGQCTVVPEHGVDRYRNGQCKKCRALVDKARVRDNKTIVAKKKEEKQSPVRKQRVSASASRTSTRMRVVSKATLEKERKKALGLSVFGDVAPEKPWRPEGWAPEPRVKPHGDSNTRAAS